MSLEDEVRAAIAAGSDRGKAEHDEIRRNVEADEPDKPSTEYGYVEETARYSDTWPRSAATSKGSETPS